jgi:hypothetical protein
MMYWGNGMGGWAAVPTRLPDFVDEVLMPDATGRPAGTR